MKNLIIVLLMTFVSLALNAHYTTEPETTRVIAFSGLKIRSTPGNDGMVLDVISFGEKVDILEHLGTVETIEWVEGSWVKVAYKNIEGYVFDGFLTNLPIPFDDFELSQNDLDVTYPLLAWAENNFDQIRLPDTIERADHDKVVQYFERGIVVSREDSEYKFESIMTIPDIKISDAYNLIRSMLLTKTERQIFESHSLFISDRGLGIDKITIDIDAPIVIKKNLDGSVKISVYSFHEGCGQ